MSDKGTRMCLAISKPIWGPPLSRNFKMIASTSVLRTPNARSEPGAEGRNPSPPFDGALL